MILIGYGFFFVLQPGVMGTHDEETRKFFKHSSVICVLSPRYASSKLGLFKQQASPSSSIYVFMTLTLISVAILSTCCGIDINFPWTFL